MVRPVPPPIPASVLESIRTKETKLEYCGECGQAKPLPPNGFLVIDDRKVPMRWATNEESIHH